MWKEAAVAYFKVMSRHLPGRTEDSHESPQNTGCPCQGWNPRPAKYEAGMTTTRPQQLGNGQLPEENVFVLDIRSANEVCTITRNMSLETRFCCSVKIIAARDRNWLSVLPVKAMSLASATQLYT